MCLASVSVVLVNWNTPIVTAECVRSILTSTYQNISVFVIDNGSTEDNYNQLNQLVGESVNILRLPENTGYVGGVNHALSNLVKKDFDYILIMNNDTIIDSHAIEELVKASQRYHDNCIVTGKVYSYDKPDVLQHIGSDFDSKGVLQRLAFMEKDTGLYDKEAYRDMIDDVFWLLPTKIVRDVGLYCNYFWFNHEQADYALRAKKMGYKLLYTPNAKLWHMESYSVGKTSPKRQYWEVKSQLVFKWLHHSYKEFYVFYLVKWLVVWKRFLILILSGKFTKKEHVKLFLAWPCAMIDFTKWVYHKVPDTGHFPKILR